MEQMTPFINYAKHVSAHGYKLVCLHHAGAGASAYLKWQNVFGDHLEVLPVQLPGHETRMREQPFSSCTEATDAVVQALQPYLETGRFSIFGHSMGGILAYEAAKKWIRMGLRPDVCFISSTYVEDMTNVPFSIDLDDAAFLERVRQYGGVGEAGRCWIRRAFGKLFYAFCDRISIFQKAMYMMEKNWIVRLYASTEIRIQWYAMKICFPGKIIPVMKHLQFIAIMAGTFSWMHICRKLRM